MKTLKYILYSFLGIIVFSSFYITLNTQSKYTSLQLEVDQLRIEQQKLEFYITNQPDTIIINTFIDCFKNK